MIILADLIGVINRGVKGFESRGIYGQKGTAFPISNNPWFTHTSIRVMNTSGRIIEIQCGAEICAHVSAWLVDTRGSILIRPSLTAEPACCNPRI